MTQSFHEYVCTANPLVSVIIPCYGKAQFIEETLNSVFDQKHKNIEIIIVNDGSPDNTSSVCNQIIKQNPQIKIQLLEKQNGGVSEARNFGISKANSQIIICLDADDIAKPDFISTGIELMRSKNANLVTTNVEFFGIETGEWTPLNYDPYYERYSNLIPTLVMYDRDLWVKSGGYKKSFPFNEDWDFYLTCIKDQNLSVARIEEKMLLYRMTSDGLAKQFIKDTGDLSLSLVSTSNCSLYAVSEILYGHDVLAKMPLHWISKIEKQDLLHQNEWLLKFWLGLVAQNQNNIEKAKSLFGLSIQHSNAKEWQPLYKYALILEQQNDLTNAMNLFHLVRTLEPEMNKYVGDKISKFSD
jgi:glycosyltransferase involved in cell wall biosynthesis